MRLKFGLWMLCLVILSAISLAEIKINEPVQGTYNLGDKLSINVQYTSEKSFDGLLKSTLNCGDKSILYYAAPIKVSSGESFEYNIPALAFTSYMIGQCNIVIFVSSFDGTVSEERAISGISVIQDLNLILDEISDKLPNDDIVFKGTLKNGRGGSPEKATLKIKFNDADYDVQFSNSEFSYTIKIPEKIISGIYSANVYAFDSYGNKAEQTVRFKILSKATSIEIFPKEESYYPMETVEVNTLLLDQVRKIMEDEINLEITSPSGRKVFSSNVMSNAPAKYVLEQFSEPGNYQVKAVKDEISSTKFFSVNAVEKLEVSFEGNNLSIRNSGNVKFDNFTTIIAESQGKQFLINKKIFLMPGQIIKFDLSENVKDGSYFVNVQPSAKDFAVIYIEKNISSTEGIMNVTVQGHDSFFEKTFRGLSGITGGFLGGTDEKSNVVYVVALLGMIIITAGIILGYQSTRSSKPGHGKIKQNKNKFEHDKIALDDGSEDDFVSFDEMPKEDMPKPKQSSEQIIKVDKRKRDIDSMLDREFSKKWYK